MSRLTKVGPRALERRVGALAANDEDELEIVVAQLRRITRAATLEFALRVGAVVLHHFYDGDPDAWRARGPKTVSFRRLAAHPDLPLSAGALYRCVAIFELCERFNAPARWEHLGVSHMRLVLGLTPPEQERLLCEANEHRWSVRTLHAAVKQRKEGRSRRGGRIAKPAVTKALRTVEKCLLDQSVRAEDLTSLPPEEIHEIMLLLDASREALDRLSASLTVARQMR